MARGQSDCLEKAVSELQRTKVTLDSEVQQLKVREP